MNDPAAIREVRALLEEPGCVPCLAARLGARRFLHQVLWEGVTDIDVRRRIRGSGGYCREHFAVAADLARDEGLAPGLAIILADLLGRLDADAGVAVEGRKLKSRWKRRSGSSSAATDGARVCAACDAAGASAHRALWLLARIEAGTQIHTEVSALGRTLCAPHLREGLAASATPEQRARLTEMFQRGLASVQGDLAGFIRKTEHRHRDEPVSAGEATSWDRALDLIAGAQPMRRRNAQSVDEHASEHHAGDDREDAGGQAPEDIQ